MNVAEFADATPGWLLDGEGEMLAHYAGGRFVVEIGSYCGKSTLWIASTAAHVVSIDPHRGNPEMAPGQDCHHPEVWDDEVNSIDSAPFLRRTLYRAGLEHKVTVICADANQVTRFMGPPADGMTFIDGNHNGTGPMKDYKNWAPDTGVLAFHDSAIPAVRDAVAQARLDGWTQVEQVGDSLKVFTR